MLHDDVDVCFLAVNYPTVVSHYIVVTESTQNVDLANYLLLLLLVHDAVVELLPDEHLSVGHAADLLHFAKAALADVRNYLVLLVVH